MINSMLIARTNEDRNTFYPYKWVEKVIKKAPKQCFIIDLKNEAYNRTNFIQIINKDNPDFLFFNSHGASDLIYGYNQATVVVMSNDNECLFSNKIVYAFCCSTATELGEKAVAKGCKAFIGFKEDIVIPIEKPVPLDILKDKYAKPFMEASNEVPLTILDGGTPQEAYKNSFKRYDEAIKTWKKKKDKRAEEMVKQLILNKESLTILLRKKFN